MTALCECVWRGAEGGRMGQSGNGDLLLRISKQEADVQKAGQLLDLLE